MRFVRAGIIYLAVNVGNVMPSMYYVSMEKKMIRINTPMMFVVFMTFIGLNAGGTSVYGQYMGNDEACEWIFSPTEFYEGAGQLLPAFVAQILTAMVRLM